MQLVWHCREKDMNSFNCVAMDGNQTTLTHPETKEEKPFTFDYSYWSHDGFRIDEATGEAIGVTPKYATQRMVYDNLGKEVLQSAFTGQPFRCCPCHSVSAGYNSTLFAYGQTGSGKSYSMVGYGANKGIIPIA